MISQDADIAGCSPSKDSSTHTSNCRMVFVFYAEQAFNDFSKHFRSVYKEMVGRSADVL